MELYKLMLGGLRRLRRLPWLWNIIVRSSVSAGLSLENLTLLETISRPWWLYRAAGRVPQGRMEKRPPLPVTTEDVALCERLIEAFAAAENKAGQVEASPSIWGWIRDTHQRQLSETLERHDALELASLLASMFQEKFVWGITGRHDLRDHETALGLRILSLKSLDILVSLAEAVGAVPVESPGQAGLAFDGGIAKLMADVDRALGFRVNFPSVGAPYGLIADGHLITLDTPEQIYGALRLDQARRDYLLPRPESSVRIVEIGGGYGGMCYWFLRMCPNVGPYTIIDLPIMNVLQGYFLARAQGAKTVSLFGEDAGSVRVLPNSALAEVDTPFDVLVNKDSMPEMSHDTMTSYLEWGRVNCDGLFYSYNQETNAEFPLVSGCQGVVYEAIERVGGFKRMRRDSSWLRRGYVEEIYLPTSSSSKLASCLG
jgi:hypothetical protein